MFLVRGITYCMPGKARPMVEKFIALAKDFQGAMKGYHDLIDQGRREIYMLEK